MKKRSILALGVLVLAGISACGNKGADTPKSQTEKTSSVKSTTSSTTPAEKPTGNQEGVDASKVDYSKPTVVIEAGDIEALKDLAKKNQNMETAQGTVVKITGTFSQKGSQMTVEHKVDGGASGIVFKPIGDFKAPKDGTKIEVTGVIVKAQLYMELQAPAEHIKVME